MTWGAIRLHHRAAFSSHGSGAKDLARGRCGRWHGGGLFRTDGSDSVGSGASALRMAAAKFYPRSRGLRRGDASPCASDRPRPDLFDCSAPGARPAVIIWAVVIGILAGFGSGLLTVLVYFCEDIFLKLPIHWMWWPAIGAVFVGFGGWFDPRVLGWLLPDRWPA